MMEHVVGDCKGLYDESSWESFQDLWGMAWWEYEVDPTKKIEEWIKVNWIRISQIADNCTEILADTL